MFDSRRRQLAWLFLLVLAMELAFLCCASAHICHHLCTGAETCAICACVRAGHRRALSSAALATLVAGLVGPLAVAPALPSVPLGDTPVARRVRLND